MKYPLLGFTFFVGILLWFIPPPGDVSEQAWHMFAIFCATIFGIIASPLPMGAMAFIGLCATVVTGTLNFAEAFSGFSNHVVWLIVFAFFVARGFIKTGLGSRLSYLFLMLLGKNTLGLGYGIVATDLILAPSIPSNTARSGGVILPILESLSETFDSHPHDPSARRVGSFLTKVSFHSTCITSAMFLTSMAGNPLIAEIAKDNGLIITWGSWAKAAIVPGLISLLVVPWVIYKIYPPQIKESPHAPEFARQKLEEMGKIKKDEWIMAITFFFLIVLWMWGPIKPAVTALIGLVILLITGVLTWKDIRKEEGAWETLVWFSVLLMMASQINKLGMTAWFSDQMVSVVKDFDWLTGFIILSLTYFYTHYFFASNLAHIGAMYSSFLLVAIALGTPIALAAMVLAFFSSLFGALTHYGCGPAALLFGAGYVRVGSWWKVGLIISVINILIWMIIGGFWWKFLGLW